MRLAPAPANPTHPYPLPCEVRHLPAQCWRPAGHTSGRRAGGSRSRPAHAPGCVGPLLLLLLLLMLLLRLRLAAMPGPATWALALLEPHCRACVPVRTAWVGRACAPHAPAEPAPLLWLPASHDPCMMHPTCVLRPPGSARGCCPHRRGLAVFPQLLLLLLRSGFVCVVGCMRACTQAPKRTYTPKRSHAHAHASAALPLTSWLAGSMLGKWGVLGCACCLVVLG